MLIAVMKIHHIFHSLASVNFNSGKIPENYFTLMLHLLAMQHDDVCAD